jgi:hypothetical protein
VGGYRSNVMKLRAISLTACLNEDKVRASLGPLIHEFPELHGLVSENSHQTRKDISR